MSESLFYQEKEGALYLRAEGHLTASLCGDLREKSFARLDGKPPITAMYIDLSLCTYMDSTFMGLLVGFNKRLSRLGKKLTVVNPSAEAQDLLTGLGVSALVDILTGEIPFPQSMNDISKTQHTNVDVVLNAHENLMELSDENKKKFGTLHSILKKQQESGQ